MTGRAAVIVALLVVPRALGQSADGEPALVSPERDLEPFHFDGLEAALELEWRRRVDEVDPETGPSTRTSEDRLREILELRTTGWIGHPNIVEFDLGGRLWLEQRWLDLDDDRSRLDQTLGEWNISALALKESRLPFTLYTRQNISDLDRQFGASIENRFRESGVRVNVRSSAAPTNLQFFRRRIDQRDPTSAADFEIDQDTFLADGRIRLGADHRFAWDVKYDDVDESGDLRQPISFHRFEGNATHALDFGSEQQHVVRTRLRLFDETGDRQLRQVRIEPRVRLRHSDDLTSWYDYSFGRDDRPVQEQITQRASANVRHQLFDSLTSIGTLGYERLDIRNENFDSDEIFLRGDLDYTKRIPYGRLSATLGGLVSRLEQSDRGSPVDIADDVFVFGPANMVVINQRNVEVNSIVVTDVPGIIVYTDGIDYSVLGLPDRVEITRLAGGAIAPGQAVSIDYVIGPEPGGTTDTTNFSIDLRYTIEEGLLNGLSFYLRYQQQDESRTIIVDDFPENDFTDVRYGIEYNLRQVYLRAEQQHRDSTISPFDAVRFEARYVEPLGRGSNLILAGLYQEIDRELEVLTTRTATLSAQWNQRIDERLRIALLLQYQWTDDTAGNDTDAFEQQFDLTWRRGRTEFYAQVRNSFNDSASDTTSFQRFIVGLRREF